VPPTPKRSDQRRRRNKTGVERAAAGAAIKPPPARRDWHPIARDWYRALAQSGQSQFYEATDWHQARALAELLSRALNTEGKPPAMIVQAWLAGASELLTTEGARRRARVELERHVEVDEDAEAEVASLAMYKRKMTGA
jgi:hypothetical protein